MVGGDVILPCRKGRSSTVDLLLPTSLDHRLFKFWKIFTFYKTSYPNEEVSRIEPFLSVSVPWSFQDVFTFFICLGGEALLKGKAQYSWPPCTNYLKPPAFDIAKIISSFTKQATLITRPMIQPPFPLLKSSSTPSTKKLQVSEVTLVKKQVKVSRN